MHPKGKNLLQVLDAELRFVDGGGYTDLSTHGYPQPFFSRSPSCPNFGLIRMNTPCSDCDWMRFVPAHLRDQEFPCRFVQVSPNGETIMTVWNDGGVEAVTGHLRHWLPIQMATIEADSERQ
jgi:hypothetical protein